ncbi:hypothetical protein QCA50_008046 [Cerrena zonata]|uniref:Uncharacterized protein n=1 Tax=Cerrena zonata TaxID=2478898 RepID=A0AAW0G4B2_9APHY
MLNMLDFLSTSLRLATEPESLSSSPKSQWQNPNIVLSILTIVGGDIIQRAIAQLSGHPSYITPVAFSFGWVGYTLSTALTIMCEGRIMPPVDCDCILINAKSQYSRMNRSWILGRLVRDHEKDPLKPGLTVSFYKTSTNRDSQPQGIPTSDWVYYSGIVVILVQLVIAAIPGIVSRDWSVLTVTALGTSLALLSGALPKWKAEKWSGRKSQKDSDRTVICLTRGNGYSDVIVIISEGKDQYRLEDLANARNSPVPHTIPIALMLCTAQVLLLLIVANLNDHAWLVLGISTLGILQNALAASVRRDPSASGIHLEQLGDPVSDKKVMKALQKAEEQEQYVGLSLLPIFFPGGLRADEEEWRDGTFAKYKV